MIKPYYGIWQADALGLLRRLPTSCPRLTIITDPPYGIGYEYAIDDGVSYWSEPIRRPKDYAAWFAPYYAELVRVTPMDGLLIFWQAINYRSYYKRWYGKHSVLVSIRFRMHYFVDLIVVQRKTPRGIAAVPLHKPFIVHNYRAEDRQSVMRAAKTVAECKELVQRYTTPDTIVCDPFGGTGTTAVAAKRLGRRFIMAEAHKQPFDLARQRLEKEGLK